MSAWKTPWPHQTKAVIGVLDAIKAGHRRVLLTSPTGAGKTRIAAELVSQWIGSGDKAALYLHRKMLLEQASGDMKKFGLDHGIRAAGYKDQWELPFQICSMQTEDARSMRADEHKRTQLHDAKLVIVDEAHLQGGDSMQAIARKHLQNPDCVVVGITATPVNLSHAYDHLVTAGVNSELRKCGALVAAHHYGPDEPDMKGIRQQLGEDLTEEMNKKAIMRTGVFGRVIESYKQLNPDQRPTILFAPGVAESIWFAEQFTAAGFPWAHIDGDTVWIKGESHNTSKSLREDILGMVKDGTIKGVSNRFVLREGLDLPVVSHGIFACRVGSLQSWIQMGGRFLRSHAGKTFASIQDHGGMWHLHGSLNEDRYWSLDDTAAGLAAKRERAILGKQQPEPVRCPQCSKIGPPGRYCAACGHDMNGQRKTRMVVQSDGQLKPMEGDVYREKAVDQRPEAEKKWTQTYYRARNAGFTFNQARGLYQHENYGLLPPPTASLMPKRETDWFRKVADIPRSELT